MSKALLSAVILLGTAYKVTGLSFSATVVGSSVKLRCNGGGGVKILVITGPDGTPYRNPDPNRGLAINFELKEEDNPKYIGTWTCTAKSLFGTASATVTVSGSTQSDSVSARMSYEGPSSLNETLELDCIVTGPNSTVVTWYKDGQTLSDPRIALSSTPQDGRVIHLLAIANPKDSDAGTYRCEAISGLSRSMVSTTVFFSDDQQGGTGDGGNSSSNVRQPRITVLLIGLGLLFFSEISLMFSD